MLNAKLVVVGGEVKATEIRLKLPCIIGRGKGSNVTLPHPLVSRQHCELFESSGRLWVRDLGSLNGTYVNNEKITETELPPNELLTVGAVTFRALYEPLADTNPPEGPPPTLAVAAATADDDNQTTIRVTGDVQEVSSFEEVPTDEPVEIDEIEEMPSTPLFEDGSGSPKTVPMPLTQRPTVPGAPRPPSPVAIPMAVTPGTVPPSTPVPQAPAEDAEAVEPAADDDDLDEFLKSLGKK
jgi:predicted component of type VI protein secretion system